MHAIAAHLVTEGHSVDVITSQPSYAKGFKKYRRSRCENIGGVNIKRLTLPREISRPLVRIINALCLGIAVVMRGSHKRYDVIVATTIPPVLGGFFSALTAKLIRARFIYFCMDLHPEIGSISGDFANQSLFRALQLLDDWTCRQAQPVLVHSSDMCKTLHQRARGAEYRIELMNNFALPTNHHLNEEVGWQLNKQNIRLRLIYAGNIGRFQGLATLLDAMGRIKHRKDIELIMMGDGADKPALIAQQRKSNANVQFFDYQPVEMAKAAIKTADIGVVALISGMYRFAYPGKTMAYLEQGRPILAVIETESELANQMLEEGYGFSVPIGDAEALAKLLVQLADDKSWKEQMSQSALAAFEKHFSAPVVLDKWSKLLKQQ